MKWLYLSLLGLLTIALFPSSAQATCSGSGITWSCTTGSTSTQVNAAITSASDGATITMANGSYSGTWLLDNTKGVTLICASVQGCTHSGGVQMGTYSGLNTKLYRISGFAFTANAGEIIWWCSQGGCVGDFTQIRIDHNSFTSTTGAIIDLGENTSIGKLYGVVDHNTFTGSTNALSIRLIGATSNAAFAAWPASTLGTANNLFIEDNTWNYTSQGNSGEGCIDSWSSSSVVARHNTTHNCRLISHGICHAGPVNFELYNNTIDVPNNTAGYRDIHHQGSGTMMVFNNVLTPTDPSNIAIMYYRSGQQACGPTNDLCNGLSSSDQNRSPNGTYSGYACYRQPGRDKDGILHPIYLWNNIHGDGSEVNASIELGSDTFHIKPNRDYYEAVSKNAQTTATSPFNGTTGMGFGTLANRPTTCTTGTEALDAGKGGAGYFATDVGPQGTLYACTATNTWTTYYTPYTYPHPLVASGAGTPTVSLSPTSLNFGNQPIQVTSSPQSVTLTNTGTATLTITSITLTGANPSNYSISSNPCGGSLGAGLNCVIGVTFTPSAVGSRTANLTFTTNATSSPDNVPLTGTGQAPVASFSPTSATFNGIKVGLSSSPIAIALTNVGNATMSITSITLTGANPSDYSSNTTCGATLTVSSSCAINVTFSPLLQGLRGANISVISNTVTSPDLVPLAGIGFNPVSGTGTLSGTGTIKVQP